MPVSIAASYPDAKLVSSDEDDSSSLDSDELSLLAGLIFIFWVGPLLLLDDFIMEACISLTDYLPDSYPAFYPNELPLAWENSRPPLRICPGLKRLDKALIAFLSFSSSSSIYNRLDFLDSS